MFLNYFQEYSCQVPQKCVKPGRTRLCCCVPHLPLTYHIYNTVSDVITIYFWIKPINAAHQSCAELTQLSQAVLTSRCDQASQADRSSYYSGHNALWAGATPGVTWDHDNQYHMILTPALWPAWAHPAGDSGQSIISWVQKYSIETQDSIFVKNYRQTEDFHLKPSDWNTLRTFRTFKTWIFVIVRLDRMNTSG